MKHKAFVSKIPGLINHKTWGIQYLETGTYSGGCGLAIVVMIV